LIFGAENSWRLKIRNSGKLLLLLNAFSQTSVRGVLMLKWRPGRLFYSTNNDGEGERRLKKLLLEKNPAWLLTTTTARYSPSRTETFHPKLAEGPR